MERKKTMEISAGLAKAQSFRYNLWVEKKIKGI
jgi:hypothetical protein